MGSINSDDIYNMFTLPFNNEEITNLEAGIQAATAELSGPAHRPNAKKVMMVMATTFDPLGTNPPQDAANNFTSDGGIIIVYSN